MTAKTNTCPDLWKWNKTRQNNIPHIFVETHAINTSCTMRLHPFLIFRVENTPVDCCPDAESQIRLLNSQKHQGKHALIQRFGCLFKKRMAARFYFMHFFYRRISTEH